MFLTQKKPAIRKKRFMKPTHYSSKSLTALQQLFTGEMKQDHTIPTLRRGEPEESRDLLDEEMEGYLYVPEILILHRIFTVDLANFWLLSIRQPHPQKLLTTNTTNVAP